MTYKNAKTILFAALIVALILPFSAMGTVDAETSKTDSKIRFEKFLTLAENQQKAQQIIDRIHDIHGNEDQVKQLESKIQNLQQKMDELQQQEIDSVVISEERLQSLELQGEKIMKEIRNPQSVHFIDKESAFFVNQITGEIVVVVDSKGTDYKQSLQVKETNNIENKVDGVPFTVGRIADVETFVVLDGVIQFDGIWDEDKTYAAGWGSAHGDKDRTYSSGVEIYANTWNHALDIYDNNSGMTKYTMYF